MRAINQREHKRVEYTGGKLSLMDGRRIAKDGGRILIDISIPAWGRKSHRCYITEKTVYDMTRSDVTRLGYMPCEGLKTSLSFYGIPIFARFNGWKKCDYKNGFTDQFGRPCPESEEAYP